MIIKSYELYKFQIPLISPLKIANEEITIREGLILRISDENDNIGVGEISPLPGLHKENLSQAIEQIKKKSSEILKSEIPKNIELLNGGFESWLEIFELYPSVQFGIESAFISLLAAQQGKTTVDMFNNSPKKSIKINALLTGTLQQIVEKTNQYLNDGFTVFKLKVGRDRIDENIKLVNRINSLIYGKAKLRLDANQAWALDEALYFFQNIDASDLEYIEEPLNNFEELPELESKIKIPIALDENLLKIHKLPKNYLSHIKAMIIKPTVIGGIEKSLRLIRFAEDIGIAPVISDTFQSGVGLSTLITIAHIINDGIAMGFDTYSWIEQDILKSKFKINQGNLFLNKIKFSDTDINYSKLQKI